MSTRSSAVSSSLKGPLGIKRLFPHGIKPFIITISKSRDKSQCCLSDKKKIQIGVWIFRRENNYTLTFTDYKKKIISYWSYWSSLYCLDYEQIIVTNYEYLHTIIQNSNADLIIFRSLWCPVRVNIAVPLKQASCSCSSVGTNTDLCISMGKMSG